MEQIKAVEKVKVEMVNDFEFRKNKDGTYDSDLEAKVSIKVKNAVRNITCMRKRNYGERAEGVGEYDLVIREKEHLEKEFSEFSIEADFSEILKKYQEKAKVMDIERSKIHSEKMKKQWDNSWVHSFYKGSKGDKFEN